MSRAQRLVIVASTLGVTADEVTTMRRRFAKAMGDTARMPPEQRKETVAALMGLTTDGLDRYRAAEDAVSGVNNPLGGMRTGDAQEPEKAAGPPPTAPRKSGSKKSGGKRGSKGLAKPAASWMTDDWWRYK